MNYIEDRVGQFPGSVIEEVFMNVTHSLPMIAMTAALLSIANGAFGQTDFRDGSQYSDKLRSGGTGPQMVVVPAGILTLGEVTGSEGASVMVRFDESFAISAHEITAGQYREFLAATRSGELRDFAIEDDSLPVHGVSWDAAEAYVTWLSRETGHHYRLPSSTEWEYAARAGTATTYNWGNQLGENLANCLDCKSGYQGRHAPVGSFPPNRWQLYDMHGNVWEWTKDCVDPNSAPPTNGLPQLFGNCDLRELRGGSAESDGWSIRATSRAFGQRKMEADDVGFRVVMELPD
jgi:formylglycine-generating enzyme required for sulfatase activity